MYIAMHVFWNRYALLFLGFTAGSRIAKLWDMHMVNFRRNCQPVLQNLCLICMTSSSVEEFSQIHTLTSTDRTDFRVSQPTRDVGTSQYGFDLLLPGY